MAQTELTQQTLHIPKFLRIPTLLFHKSCTCKLPLGLLLQSWFSRFSPSGTTCSHRWQAMRKKSILLLEVFNMKSCNIEGKFSQGFHLAHSSNRSTSTNSTNKAIHFAFGLFPDLRTWTKNLKHRRKWSQTPLQTFGWTFNKKDG